MMWRSIRPKGTARDIIKTLTNQYLTGRCQFSLATSELQSETSIQQFPFLLKNAQCHANRMRNVASTLLLKSTRKFSKKMNLYRSASIMVVIVLQLLFGQSTSARQIWHPFTCPKGWRENGTDCFRFLPDLLDKQNALQRCQNLLTFGNMFEQMAKVVQWDSKEKSFKETQKIEQILKSQKHSLKHYSCKFSLKEQKHGLAVSKKDENEAKLNFLPLFAAPKLIHQPEDSLFFLDIPTQTVRLKCEAEYNPHIAHKPIYSWHRGSGGPIHSAMDSRITQIEGELYIRNVSNKDVGSYFCKVKNHYGTVVSRKASVRAAYVHPFPTSRLDVFAVEGKGRQVPCLAPNHYPVSASYAWLYKTSNMFLQESERIFTAKDGTLYFSYYTKADEEQYACSLLISELQTGHYGPFFRLRTKLETYPSQDGFSPYFPRELPKVWQSNQALEGKEIVLECFAFGRPSPTYQWIRVDKPMDKQTVQFRSFSRQLRILNATVQHSGIYRCIADNEYGSVSKEVRLEVFASPKISSTTENYVEEKGKTWTLWCEATGKPEVHYEWLKNGTALNSLLLPQEDRKRILIDKNRLQIKHLREEDSGIYQCLAFNQFGQDILTTELYVRQTPDKIKWREFHKDFHVLENSDAILRCADRTGHWSSRGQWIVGKSALQYDQRLSLSKAGDLLTIKNVTKRDSDTVYECRIAYRQAGIIQRFRLVVYHDFYIRIRPANKHVLVGQNLTLYCKYAWTNNAGSTAEIAPWWSFNGYPIEQLRQFNSATLLPLPGSGTQLTISPISLLHHGNYSCHVPILPLWTASASSEVTVEGAPLAPIEVIAQPQANSRIYLRWKIPNEQEKRTLPISKFRVESKTTYAEGWKIVKDDIRWNLNETTVERDILPFNKYRFRVRAANSIGWSDASDATPWTETAPGPPSVIEDVQLSAQVYHTSQITIQWKMLPKHLWGDSSLGYILEWRPVGDFKNTQTEKLPATTNSTLINLSYTVQTNETAPCKRYELYIRPYNNYGEGPNTLPVYAIPVVKKPSSVYRVDAKALNATCVQLYLVDKVIVNQCEPVDWFEIFYWASADPNNKHFHKAPFILLKQGMPACNLTAETEYAFSAIASNSAGEAPASSLSLVKTYRPAPSDIPICCSVSAADKIGFVTVGWRMSRRALEQDEILGYQVTFANSYKETERRVFDLPIDSGLDFPPKMKLGPVKPTSAYTVTVKAYNVGGYGPSSKTALVLPSVLQSISSSGKLKASTILLIINSCLCIYFVLVSHHTFHYVPFSFTF
ncbi:Contactin-5 [Trichinella murrelli]|uniref:Contactin-5 n=1 Tax=Trichinella murrelli TaxID=144512 RepID=A0A0V0UCG8_9BILA|nr:Contactin-5 [Trichinella murrelli]